MIHNLRVLLLSSIFLTLSTPAQTISSHLWKGTGSFSVNTPDTSYPQACDFVMVQLLVSETQAHLSTSYNCQDEEDQEFVPLTLDRLGDQLFYDNTFVGTLKDNVLQIELKNGRQIENYWLDFQERTLLFRHESRIGTPSVGVLKAHLPRI